MSISDENASKHQNSLVLLYMAILSSKTVLVILVSFHFLDKKSRFPQIKIFPQD